MGGAIDLGDATFSNQLIDEVAASELGSGLLLIFIGLFKKVVIADALAPFVQETFDAAGTAGWVQLLVAVYAFSLQIYGDFSGYSSIARGSARLLGNVRNPRARW